MLKSELSSENAARSCRSMFVILCGCRKLAQFPVGWFNLNNLIYNFLLISNQTFGYYWWKDSENGGLINFWGLWF